MSSFRFRKMTEYALMMMAQLSATEREWTPISHMQDLGMSRAFLVKIARELISSGLIVAKEGRGGGYKLAKKPESITLKEIVVAIEGEVATVACLVHGAKKCPLADHCPHKSMMGRLTDEINYILDKYTLAEFE